jgi:hypothetical protein
MNKTVTLFISLIILSSCQEKKKYGDRGQLCKILGEITENDQKYRGLQEMTDPFFRVLDSLTEVNNISNADYGKLTTEKQLEWGKKARAISEKIPQMSEKKQDSLMQLQIIIDNKNTELLIDITKEIGWVSKPKLGCKEYVSAWIVFRHSQSQYWEEIREIIEKEKIKKRLLIKEYKIIDNHIKGRPKFEKKLNK